MVTRLRVWDLPTRLFHWSLAALALTAAYIGYFGRESWLWIHLWAGYAVGALVLFRLVWGFLGSEFSRFDTFLPWPGAFWRHLGGLLRGRPPHTMGHNPVAGTMVFALLLVLAGLVVSGVMVLGGEEKQGLLAGVLTYRMGSQARRVHEFLAIAFNILVALHLMGVALSSVLERQNLARSMITGDKRLEGPAPVAPRPAHPLAAAAVLAVLAVALGLPLARLQRVPALGLPPLAPNPTYQAECGACHFAFPPTLLPAASWKLVMADLSNHFGEDATLPAATTTAIEAWLVAHAAESWDSETSNRLRRVDPAQPTRITATPYWKATHAGLPPALFTQKAVGGAANCNACHRDAATGRFDDQNIRVPQPKESAK